jgi:hypothetical protein
MCVAYGGLIQIFIRKGDNMNLKQATLNDLEKRLTLIEAHIGLANIRYGYDCPKQFLPEFEKLSGRLHDQHGKILNEIVLRRLAV